MSVDNTEEFLIEVAERYDATELCELLDLRSVDIVEVFRDLIIERGRELLEAYR